MEYLFLILIVAYAAWTLTERSRRFEESRRPSFPPSTRTGGEPVLPRQDLLPFYLLKLLADGEVPPEQYRFLSRMKPGQLTTLLQNHELLPRPFLPQHQLAAEHELTDRHLFRQATVVEVFQRQGLLSQSQRERLDRMEPEAVQEQLIHWGLLPRHLASLDLLALQEMMLRQ